MRHRCRLRETGWAEFGYFLCYFKMVAPRALVFQRLVKGNEALGTRLWFTGIHIIGDKLFIGANFSLYLQFTIAISTFGAKILDTINKSKTQDCKRNLSPTMLKGNQVVFS